MSPRRRDLDWRPGGTSFSPRVSCRVTGAWLPALLAAAIPGAVHAFTVSISSGLLTTTLYLQIGVGAGGTFTGGGLGTNTTQNHETVSVAGGVAGNGTAQAMTTDSTVTTSAYNGRTFCTVPGQLYIGGYYQGYVSGIGLPSSAAVTATVPAALTDAGGATISFSQISWTSSGIGDSGAEPFPAGTFAPGTQQTVGSIALNQWAESCWTFSYANTTLPPAGTYTGVVLYTLSDP
jgi:hypothetical protein